MSDERPYHRCKNCQHLSAEPNKGICIDVPGMPRHDFEPVIVSVRIREEPKVLWHCPAPSCSWADASSHFERWEGDPCPRCKTPIVDGPRP